MNDVVIAIVLLVVLVSVVLLLASRYARTDRGLGSAPPDANAGWMSDGPAVGPQATHRAGYRRGGRDGGGPFGSGPAGRHGR